MTERLNRNSGILSATESVLNTNGAYLICSGCGGSSGGVDGGGSDRKSPGVLPVVGSGVGGRAGPAWQSPASCSQAAEM